MDEQLQVSALYPVYCSGVGISHIVLMLLDQLAKTARVQYWTPGRLNHTQRAYHRVPLPDVLTRGIYKLDPGAKWPGQWTEHRFERNIATNTIAYLWPAVSVEVYERLNAKGCSIAIERINCHRATIRALMEDAYDRLGWPRNVDVTQEDERLERVKFELADYIFSPSPCVTSSLTENGVEHNRILNTSFGWDPLRFRDSLSAPRSDPRFTILFVGQICVRKGVPLLLRAWEKLKIKGRLALVGRIDPEIAERCASLLNAPGVEHRPFTLDLGAEYRNADLFAFPTIEEGSPLVTYEALAHGLPIITTAMGAGEIVRDGVEGLVLSPHDLEAWIAALERVSSEHAFRASLAENAERRAQMYTWEQTGIRRRAHWATIGAHRN